MKRFVAVAITVGGLSVPAPAAAHTLPLAHARADVTNWARTMASTTQSRENPTTIHCIGVMQVRYVAPTFYREYDYPVASCAVRNP